MGVERESLQWAAVGVKGMVGLELIVGGTEWAARRWRRLKAGEIESEEGDGEDGDLVLYMWAENEDIMKDFPLRRG